jgi:hypothetical protein
VLGGLPLPPGIVSAMLAGHWAFPSSQAGRATLEELFGEAPGDQAMLYSLLHMVQENAYWWSAGAEEQQLYGAGGATEERYHAIEPARSLLIGDLGHDMPLALDYTANPGSPRVLYLPPGAPGWVVVAEHVDTLLRTVLR